MDTPQSAKPPSERETFENYKRKVGHRSFETFIPKYGGPPEYKNNDLNNEWRIWQARAALSAQATPPSPVAPDLTDEQIDECMRGVYGPPMYIEPRELMELRAFARVILAARQIGGTP